MPEAKPFARILLAATVVLGVLRYWPVWDQPWGRDPASGNGQWYQGEPVRNWQRLGFGRLRGIPMLGALPTEPPAGFVYAHHPPTVTWMVNGIVSAFGLSERSIRVLPIFFSALTGGVLFWLASKWGTRPAIVAAILWLILPMSFVYGIMCNPEAPTLFWIVLTIALHDRLRESGRPAYCLVLLSQFIAGQMDWEGHFSVPALLLYEALKPRGARRLSRVALVGLASLASGVVVFCIHGYFTLASDKAFELVMAGTPLPVFSFGSLGSYLAAGARNALKVGTESVVPEAPVGIIEWLRWQVRSFTELFTWPAAIATILGAALPVVRKTELGKAGLVLLVPGVLNIVVFSKHGAGHDYWQYYLLPGVVVVSTAVLHVIQRRRLLVVSFLLATAVFAGFRIHQRMTSDRSDDDRNLTRELDALLRHDDEVLVVDVRFVPLAFYSTHWVLAEASSGHSWEHVAGLAALKKAGRLRRPLTFFVVPLGSAPPLGELAGYGTLETVEAPEVARRLPTLARFHSGPLWLLHVE